MDPLSIAAGAAGLAGHAIKLFNELRIFIQDCKEVDQNVHDLQLGVKQIQDICLLIEKYIRLLPRSDSEELENEDLFIGIKNQLAGCIAVIYKVNSKIEKVKKGGSDVISQTYRSVRFNMSKEDISECKTQIQAGILNLHLSLQLVSLQATYLAPQLANRTLLEKLEDIQKLMTEQSVDKGLQECADTYISRGATLYEKSVASSVGGFQRQPRPNPIAGWLEQLDALKLDRPASPSLLAEDNVYSSPSQPLHTQKTTTAFDNNPRTPIPQPMHFDDEDEDEFATEMVQAALSAGQTACKEANYEHAEDRLSECLALIRKLPEHRWRDYNINEIHLLLALCTFHLHDPESAEAALVSALDCNIGMDAQTELHHEAGSALTVIYIRLKKYEPARFTCENVYRSRRKLLGKDNDLCFESLALLALIHDLQELSSRANTYRSMIPKDKQSALQEKWSQLAQSNPAQAGAENGQDVESKRADLVVDEEWMIFEKQIVLCLAISASCEMLAYSIEKWSFGPPMIALRYFQSLSVVRIMNMTWEIPAYGLEFDSRGKRLFSCHGSDLSSWYPFNICVWSVATGDCLHHFNVGGETSLMMTGVRYSPLDDSIIFTHQYLSEASSDPKAIGKHKSGFTVLDSRSGKVIYQNNCGPCSIRNFSEDFKTVTICVNATERGFRVGDYNEVISHNELGDICSLHRSDVSLLSLTKGGFVKTLLLNPVSNKNRLVKLMNIARSRPEMPIEIRYAWMDLSRSGQIIIMYTTDERKTLFISMPERGHWLEKSLKLALNHHTNTILWAMSENAQYLAYATQDSDGMRIQVRDMEKWTRGSL